ncbi:SNARE domain [Carpediemonas membranifera]|uniref:SNARE domain n=1 Tax=Carpediemonas membranifera TaxID=201153 RepID=A0A8J6B7R2_9EUKA|nr:SNARE domain [Carpediemonas membranifera]|eukprot:KAG9394889.1 SNARE domain [Carpediemonas membranifera]
MINNIYERFERYRQTTQTPAILGDQESDDDARMVSKYPEWHDIVLEIRDSIQQHYSEIEALQSAQSNYISRPSMTDEDPLAAVEERSKRVARRLQDTHNKVLRLSKNHYSTNFPIENTIILRNVQTKLEGEIKVTIGLYRVVQNAFAQRLKDRDDRLGRFSIEPDEDDLSEQEGMVDVHKAVAHDRKQGIMTITQTMHELNEMAKEMAVMVVEQGTLLDRIDYNMDVTVETVEKAVKDLAKANKHQKRGWIFQVIIWGLIIVAWALMIIYILRVA